MVSTQVRPYPGPELSSELGATTCNYVIWYSAPGDDLFKEEPGEIR